ncbi:hypothetical protein CkaCkLH20_12282 [Colletotrichum karsti]|uniref:Vegetative incompatibility protein HET-E-1 n=1 Tax=Colletotrichum karsti TaxID=1095194 RepID=A0A9P6LEK7_9PEZI|nr:uncharacterized protein CkaCkLH20_12282 [Colletotrichum karsti]KAF9870196.1 hypothetical protein CkaCkLH20_12282 [Colletotrichum karsti]
MEVAGLAIGVVGLAGIIGTFRSVIDLFDLFAATKSLQRDAALLMTKLDIEKFLLLRWAATVKLVHQDYDERLDNPENQKLIAHVLACIHQLLTDASELSAKYGVEEVTTSEPSTDLLALDEASSVSETQSKTFFEELSQYRSQLAGRRTGRQQHGLRKRVRWAVHDKELFQGLISELAYFVGKLGEVLSAGSKISEAKTQLKLDELTDARTLRLIMDASKGHHHTIAEEASIAWDKLRKKTIINALWFRTLLERKHAIEAEHELTLRWVLEPSEYHKSHLWDDLSRWLQEGHDIYWVSGKAGSGKSTLMRFVGETPKTYNLLKQWHGQKPCHVATYYFWGLGVVEQNTLHGLGRSLLYQLLSQNPDLIPDVLPEMWMEQEVLDSGIGSLTLPPLAEMSRALDNVGSLLHGKGERAFLLIDGLDELVGTNYIDVISFIQRLTKNETVKALVSSRPIPDFVAAFSNCPNLRLQDLNRGDIGNYVQDVIAGHEYMRKLLERSPDQAKEIISDLVDRSSGVFLWVVLACRALLWGFSDFDRPHELRQRISELPPELEEMFKMMMEKVDPRHRQQAARLLRICYTSHRETPRREISEGPWTSSDVFALSLALVSDYDLEPVRVAPLTLAERRDLCESMEGRLRSRTAGLLELTKRSRHQGVGWAGSGCFCGGTRVEDQAIIHDPWIDARVDFIHRTVFEFLSQEHVWNLDWLVLRNEKFNPATALSLGGLQLSLQSLSLDRERLYDGVILLLRDAMAWGSQADKEMPRCRDNIFWNIQPFLDLLHNRSSEGDEEVIKPGCLSDLIFSYQHEPRNRYSHAALQFAIRGGSVNYIKSHPEAWKLASALAKEASPKCGCLPLLSYAGDIQLNAGGFRSNHILLNHSPKMVGLLLSLGCDPNGDLYPTGDSNGDGEGGGVLEARTPWTAWLWSVYFQLGLSPGMPDVLERLEVTKQFLEAGASRDAPDIDQLKKNLAHLVYSDASKEIRHTAVIVLERVFGIK